MARGPKRHLKRLNAPKHWMLDKLGGIWAPRPSTGPHKLRECMPLIILLRNKLKYALTGKEVKYILMQRLVKVDNKARTDHTYPAGFMDVVGIEKANQFFRLLYDIRGRFSVHAVSAEEAKFKLCRVKGIHMGAKAVPYMNTHDGRTIRYPDPGIEAMDTVKVDIETGKVVEFVKFETGNLAMINGGKNTGRVGIIVSREKHQGSFDIVHLKDSNNKEFATRLGNVFVIGSGNRPLISLPKRKGLKKTILEERSDRPPKM
jgi:small subunit ribosomal protein S4e